MDFNISQLFADLYLPVIICDNTDGLPITYLNVRAGLLFTPTHSTNHLHGKSGFGPLNDVLRFKSSEAYAGLVQMSRSLGHVDEYAAEVITFDNRVLKVLISGCSFSFNTANNCFLFFLVENGSPESRTVEYNRSIYSIINASFLAGDANASIQTVLALAGRQTKVSRAYIFEEISPTTTRNTYEWCDENVTPEIHNLQNLDKREYPYDVIVDYGMFISDDIFTMPKSDRALLEAQNIKSLAIITFYDNGDPIGYVGFDDCNSPRKWGYDEIQFLRSISVLISGLIKRRNAEREAKHTGDVLQIISENSGDLIYANRIDDYSIVFVSAPLADALGVTREDLIGKKCWDVFQTDANEPCSFCPIPKINITTGEDRSPVYIWENRNLVQGKVYMAKDNIVRWVDGQYVHVETATDISHRLEYEDKLRMLASTDSMTGIYNREWGNRILDEKLKTENISGSLCFIDLDGLKKTNDYFGHDAGDEFLVETVKKIRSHISNNDFLCRWGGDEFLLYISLPVDKTDRLIKSVQQEMDLYNKNSNKPFKLSFSYGIVPFESASGLSLDALVTEADALMYDDKMKKLGQSRKRRKDDPL